MILLQDDLLDDQQPKQLVITPKPQYGESYMGFVLRTAEANGYPSINPMLRHAGLTENEMRSARPPIGKLAPLFGKTPEDFAVLGETDTASGRNIPLMDHALSALYLRSKHARVCPDCVRECGHVQAFWELRYAVACPKHRRMATSRCSACHRELDWWRQGLTRCQCGYDVGNDPAVKANHAAALTLLEVIQAKLIGAALNVEALDYVGFPMKSLQAMSLTTLLGILHRIERFQPQPANDAELPEEWSTLVTASEMLLAWPTGFYRYLERVHAPQADMQAKGLRGQFESFYEAFFKNGLPKAELTFMHEAFIEFGEQHWKQAAIHPRFQSKHTSNIVGIEGLAKAIGVRPSTARKLVKNEIIPVHSRHQNGHLLFDLSQQRAFEFAEGESLSLEAAAELLDIPAAILRAYRSRGYYQARYLAKPLTLYHEKDVEALKSDLIRDCRYMEIDDEVSFRTLRKIMLQKLGPSEVKAAFIDAVRKREIRPLGIIGKRIGDLVFDAKTVKTFIESLSLQLEGSVSSEQACESLGINKSCLKALIKANQLEYTHSALGIRITDSSLRMFSDRYSSCRQLAKLKGMTQDSLLSLCKELRIELMDVSTNGNTGALTFIENVDLPLLGISYWESCDEQLAA